MTFASSPDVATCALVLDDDTLVHARNKAHRLLPRNDQKSPVLVGALVGGLIGALVGDLILREKAKSTFFDALLTPPGHYELSVSEHGMAMSNVANQHATMRWTDIATWGVDDRVFMAEDVRGNRLVLPRASIPEPIVSMIVEICTLTVKRSNGLTGRDGFGRWSQIGTGEKIVRGVIYTIGLLVLLFALLVVVLSLGPS